MPKIMKNSFFSLSLFLVLGLLAGMLVKSLALGALGGLFLHLIVIFVSEHYYKNTPEETTPEQS